MGPKAEGSTCSTTVEPGFPGISCSCKVKNSMLEHGDIDGDVFFVYLELVAGREGAGLFCCRDAEVRCMGDMTYLCRWA